VLDTLYCNIKDRSKILTNLKILHVEESGEGVTVTCDDGSVFNGAVLAGADGVHSRIRSEMWRIADQRSPGFIPMRDKTNMHAEYKCLFGISKPKEPFAPAGTQHVTYQTDQNTIVLCVHHQVFFFIFKKLERIYGQDEIPRYTAQDAERFAESNADFPIQDEGEYAGKILFKDIWQHRETFILVALEEAQYEKWTYGRIAMLGDSIQKGTPNAGQGGNGGKTTWVVTLTMCANLDC
jgi:2-polyprenyl-6-methoxyphenol hydroxylase-like FAD-dependent oxidoreductase